MGRSMLQVHVQDLELLEKNNQSSAAKVCRTLFCCKKPKATVKGIKDQALELYPEEWDVPPDLSQDDEDKLMNTQVVEQTRDEDNNYCPPAGLGTHEIQNSRLLQISPTN